MTLKNIDEYSIHVLNRQGTDGHNDTVEEHGSGSCRFKNDKIYLMYKSFSEGEMQSTIIIVEKNIVNIKRNGSVKSNMKYEMGKKTRFNYTLPYGVMEIEIDTARVHNDLSSDGGKLKIVYTLTMQGERYFNDMEITVKKK